MFPSIPANQYNQDTTDRGHLLTSADQHLVAVWQARPIPALGRCAVLLPVGSSQATFKTPLPLVSAMLRIARFGFGLVNHLPLLDDRSPDDRSRDDLWFDGDLARLHIDLLLDLLDLLDDLVLTDLVLADLVLDGPLFDGSCGWSST